MLPCKADEYLKIPMYGFTESFTFSSRAVCLQHLAINYAKKKLIGNYDEYKDKTAKLAALSIDRSDIIEKDFGKIGIKEIIYHFPFSL